MRILYHHRTQGKGAEGVHIRGVVKAFQDLGHEVFVISPPGIKPFAKSVSNTGKMNKISKLWKGVSIYMPQIVFELLEICYNFIGYINIRRIIRKTKIDFIYERYAFFGCAGTYLAKNYKIPIILEVNEISGIKRVRGQSLVRLSKLLEKKIFNTVDAIIVVSEFLKKEIEKMGIFLYKIHVMPNAVDATQFDPKKVDNEDIIQRLSLKSKIVIGFVGGFVQWHNFEFLLETFKEVVNENGKNIRLILVGDGPLRNAIRSFVATNGIDEQVILTGSIDYEEIPKYIKSMDICVIPHSNEFRSPIKMFEYMAMAKPVVAPKFKSIEDVIIDNVNGILFKPVNKISLKFCLIDLINENEKRRRLGIEARNTILSKHIWNHNVNKIIMIYKAIK